MSSEAAQEHRPTIIAANIEAFKEQIGRKPGIISDSTIGIATAVTSRSASAKFAINTPQAVFKFGVLLITRNTSVLPNEPPNAMMLYKATEMEISIDLSSRSRQADKLGFISMALALNLMVEFSIVVEFSINVKKVCHRKMENVSVRTKCENISFVISLDISKCTNCYTGELRFLFNTFLLFPSRKT